MNWHPPSPYGRDQKETPRKIENQQSISSTRQFSSTPVGFGQGFLNKEKCDNNGASSAVLASAEFYLLPRLQTALKGRRFCGATDIRWKSWQGFHRMASRCVATRSVLLHKRSILMDMWLQWLYCILCTPWWWNYAVRNI